MTLTLIWIWWWPLSALFVSPFLWVGCHSKTSIRFIVPFVPSVKILHALVSHTFGVNICFLRFRKNILRYFRSYYFAVACLHSYYLGIHSVVTSLVSPECTISVGVLPLFICSSFLEFSWGICIGIAYAFTSTSFGTNMISAMPCFWSTTIYHFIVTFFLK